MKTNNDKKPVTPDQFERDPKETGSGKSSKNPATSHNEPFDEGQFEKPKKEPDPFGTVQDKEEEEKLKDQVELKGPIVKGELEAGPDKTKGEDLWDEEGDLSI